MNRRKKGYHTSRGVIFAISLWISQKKEEIHEIGQIRDFYQQVKKEVLKEWMHGWNWINLVSWMLGTYQKRNVFERISKSWKMRSIYPDSFWDSQAFSPLESIFSRLWLSHWLWNLNILKIHSIHDLTVYKMSIFGKNWSFQIFFTKKCPFPHG